MKHYFSMLLAAISWFGVLTQFLLMMDNRVASIFETTFRFFSFFTILTNSMVAIYFTMSLLKRRNGLWSIIDGPGTLTALTLYITIVGLVYQVMLRHLWEPVGMQWIVDELLHSIIPALVVMFWYLYEDKKSLRFTQIPRWLIYPVIYLGYTLVRGHFSGFYPYPFVDVEVLGLSRVLTNSIVLIGLFVFLAVIFVGIGKIASRST